MCVAGDALAVPLGAAVGTVVTGAGLLVAVGAAVFEGDALVVAAGELLGVRVGLEGTAVAVAAGVTLTDGVALGGLLGVRVGLEGSADAVPAGVTLGVGVAVGVPTPDTSATVSVKSPVAGPEPSTMMKYVCPAVTASMTREAKSGLVRLGQSSSPHASCIPVSQLPPRT